MPSPAPAVDGTAAPTQSPLPGINGTHPLTDMAPLIRACLAGLEGDHLLVVSDGEGRLLWVDGDPSLRRRPVEAIAADHAVRHFSVKGWTASAAVVHDPDSGRVIGVLEVTSRFGTAHGYDLAVAQAAAVAVETQLRCGRHEHDAVLCVRYAGELARGSTPSALVDGYGRVIADRPAGGLGTRRLSAPVVAGETVLASGHRATVEALAPDAYLVRVLAGEGSASRPVTLRLRMFGRDRGEVEIGGRRLILSRRHTEIIALLCAAPDGLTAEALGTALYGEVVVRSSVRGEVSRLRRLLGGVIETDPYRLAARVDSDLVRVQEHLRRGALLEAATEYRGPLLPLSQAPGIVELRTTVDRWVRHAVLSGGDGNARWAFAGSAAGANDLVAWKSLLADLPFHDPRRSRAAAEVARLRATRRALSAV